MILVPALLTVWETGADVLPLNVESPLYVARTLLVPTEAEISGQPPEPFVSDATHEVPVPSVIVTEPLAVLAVAVVETTDTFTVYGCPTTVLCERFVVIVVVVFRLLTV